MKFNKIIVLLFILVISLVGYYLLSFNNTSKVKATLSKDAAEHPLGDYVIEASRKNHSIRWHISLPDNPTDKIYIDVRVEGEKKKPFIETEDIHRAILKKLFDKWNPEEVGMVFWGSFSDSSWSLPIAIASTKSLDFQDYKKNYPNSRLTYLNTLFVELANKTDAYKDLKKLFNECGAEIELESVEKVFTARAGALPFKDKLKEKGISENEQVIYDVGAAYFKVKPL